MERFDLNGVRLNDHQKLEIDRLLNRISGQSFCLEDMWALLDQVWDEFGCDNKELDWDKINKFYQHPVWILNGLFIEQHELSMQHRHAITDWLINEKKETKISKIIDYGGGFGSLARLIAEKNKEFKVDIFEPHPSDFAVNRCRPFYNIEFVDKITSEYDCLVCTDVLEHVPNPLKVLEEMIECVRLDGLLVIANNFRPVVKCHLPSTFHFQYTFKYFAQMMQLKYIGPCKGSHAEIYQKVKSRPFKWNRLRAFEKISSRFSFFFKILHFIHRKIRVRS